MSVTPAAGNGKVTVPDILGRKQHPGQISSASNPQPHHLFDGI